MLSNDEAVQVMGAPVRDSAGDKIGKVAQVYLDDVTGVPEWVTVNTGLFGTRESLVPVGQAGLADGELTVPVSKDAVKGAPQVDNDGHLEPDQEAELYRHYGLQYDDTSTGDAPVQSYSGDDDQQRGSVGAEGYDTSGPTTDEAVTRSEEQLQVGTETVQTGRARLRKYVTTETQTVQVPVSRDEVRIEREPITEANRGQAMAGGELTEEEHEIVLTEERAVVSKETVPVERVRLGTETVRDTETVTEEVHSEQIEVEGADESADPVAQ